MRPVIDGARLDVNAPISKPRPAKTACGLIGDSARHWTHEAYLLARRMRAVIDDVRSVGDYESDLAREKFRLEIEIEFYENLNQRSTYDGEAKSRFSFYDGGEL